jgi:hypothetical protein
LNQYSIKRLTCNEDKNSFLHFWSRFLEKEQSKVFDWLYAREGSEPVINLLIENKSGHCVGCLMVIPRLLFIESKAHKIGICGVFIVDKQHRTLLPALSLVKEIKTLVDKGEFELIYGLPNDKATPVFKRGGFKQLGPFVRMTKPLSISKRLNPRSLKHRLAKPLASLIDAVRLLIQPETWHRIPADLRCEVIKDLDINFDTLWKTTRHQHTILGDRCREYLQWRFNNYTGANIAIYCALSKTDNCTLGYIAFRNKDGYISIRDAILPEDPTIRHSLFLNFFRHAHSLKSKSITIDFMDNENLIEIFSAYGFSYSDTGRYVHYTTSDTLKNNQRVLTDYRNWLLFSGDMDP